MVRLLNESVGLFVMRRAKPHHGKRTAVVRVVAFNLFAATNMAWRFGKFAVTEGV